MEKTFFIFRVLATVALIVTGLNACISDSLEEIDSQGNKGREITFTATIPGVINEGTRSLTEEQENKINDLSIILVDDSGYAETVDAYDITQSGNNGEALTFKAVIPGTSYTKIHFVANASNSTGTDNLSKTIENNGKWITDVSSPNYKPMPMCGTLENVAINGSPINLTLARILAKVDISIDVSVKNFTLSSVTVCNYAYKGFVIPPATLSVPTDAIETDFNKGITYNSNAGANIVNEIYLFETPHVAPYLSTTWEANPCLIVAGKYGSEANDTYYRLDYIKKDPDTGNDIYMDIRRNYRYHVSITHVGGRGYDSYGQAYFMAPINMTTAIIGLPETDSEETLADGPYILSVSKKDFQLSRSAYETTEADNKLTIITNNLFGWSASIHTDAECTSTTPTGFWLSMSQEFGDGNYPGNEVSINCTENIAGSSRTAYIKIVSGRMKSIVTVTQSNQESFSLKILDENNKEIDMLEFVASETTAPVTQSFKVVWSPANAIVNPAVSLNASAFPSDFLDAGIENGVLISVNPGVVPISSLNDPWYQRNTVLTFSMETAAGPITKVLNLRQYNRLLTTDLKNTYLFSGSKNTFNVKANFPWKVEVKSVTSPGYTQQEIIQLFPAQAGGNNIAPSTGSVNFNLVDYLTNPNRLPTATIELQVYGLVNEQWVEHSTLSFTAACFI